MTETNPALQLVSANAAFRTTQQADNRLDAVRRLDTVVKTYADVLRNGGGQVDATLHNYELAVRTRDAARQSRERPRRKRRRSLKRLLAKPICPKVPRCMAKPGGPPPAVNMNQFKIVIPKRGEERKRCAGRVAKGGNEDPKGDFSRETEPERA